MILKYIEKQETINMVVCPCNTDIATTEALKMAQEVDPEGKRTVGNEADHPQHLKWAPMSAYSHFTK